MEDHQRHSYRIVDDKILDANNKVIGCVGTDYGAPPVGPKGQLGLGTKPLKADIKKMNRRRFQCYK